jgi:hypothetical protein
MSKINLNFAGKGASLLRAMGWKDGQRLGKREDGLAVPLAPVSNNTRTGLGYPTSAEIDPNIKYSERVKNSARERYSQILEDSSK